MAKHIISILTLLVVSLIAALTLLYDTRESGHLTPFGYAVATLTILTFVLGIVAEIHTMREEASVEAKESARKAAQKQQLGRIEIEMKANARPLLPLTMFHTLRHSPNTDALEHAFAGVPGYKSLKSDILKLVGSARLGGPLLYNPIQLTATESNLIVDGDALNKLIKNHTGMGCSVIRQPMSTTLDFFFPTDGVLPNEPTLSLEKTFTTGKPDEVKRIELFDKVIFQDSFVREWTAETQTGQNWSVADLMDSRLRVRYKFLGECGPVSIHNLQLFFGPTSAMHGIQFPEEILSRAVFKADESPLMTPGNDLAKQFFSPYVLEFDCLLSETLMADHFMKVVSR